MNRTHQFQPAQVCDFAIPNGSSSAPVVGAHVGDAGEQRLRTNPHDAVQLWRGYACWSCPGVRA